MRFSIDWIGDGPNASAEERATLCDLQIVVNDKNLCRHSTPSANEPFDHLTIPAVHLAEGLATDWWSILGGRDRKHPVLRYRNSEVAVRWSRVSRSLSDPEERSFCEAVGALGLDPYLISDAEAQFVEDAANLFAGEALIEFLAGVRELDLTGARQLLDWADDSKARPQDASRLPDLPAIAKQVGAAVGWNLGERTWAGGYRAAQVLRAELTGPSERLTSTEAIAALLGADSFAPVPSPAGAVAFVARYPEAVHIHLRRYIHSEQHLQNFAFARAIGDVVCFPDTPMSVVNRLHQAERQAAGRAFAAEFLAPVESVIKMRNSGCDLDEMACITLLGFGVLSCRLDADPAAPPPSATDTPDRHRPAPGSTPLVCGSDMVAGHRAVADGCARRDVLGDQAEGCSLSGARGANGTRGGSTAATARRRFRINRSTPTPRGCSPLPEPSRRSISPPTAR